MKTPTEHYFRPGFVLVDDRLMRIRKMGDNPEYFDHESQTWKHFGDTVAAMHSNRLTDEEARQIAKEDGIPL